MWNLWSSMGRISPLLCALSYSRNTIFRQLLLSAIGSDRLLPLNHCIDNARTLKTSTAVMTKHEYPPLDERDLEEDFVQGSGPGGQSVNRTMNCVVLKHLPSGLVVKCHETRSLEMNRTRARQRMQQRLDVHLHGEDSHIMVKKREDAEKLKERKRRTKSKLEKKKAFKEREGLNKNQEPD